MRFTIRDLLWLTLLAAVLVMWWMDRSRLGDHIHALTVVDESLMPADFRTLPNSESRAPNLPSN